MCRGGRGSIDPPTAFPLGADGSAKKQGFVGFNSCIAKPWLQLAGVVEFCAYICVGSSFAHVSSIRAGAQSQLQCIDQNRFAGSRLPCQHGEASLQIERQLLNDHEVSQCDPLERHGQEPPSFQRSFLRRVAK